MIQKKDRFGLGYKPDRRERQRFLEKKGKKGSLVSLEKKEIAQKWTYHH